MTGKCKSGTFSSSGVERINKNLVVKASLRVAVINRAEEEDPEKKQFIVNHQKNNLKEEEGEKKQLPWTTTRENWGEVFFFFWKHAALHFSKLSDSLTSNKLLSG